MQSLGHTKRYDEVTTPVLSLHSNRGRLPPNKINIRSTFARPSLQMNDYDRVKDIMLYQNSKHIEPIESINPEDEFISQELERVRQLCPAIITWIDVGLIFFDL
jgi:hypothetical protein